MYNRESIFNSFFFLTLSVVPFFKLHKPLLWEIKRSTHFSTRVSLSSQGQAREHFFCLDLLSPDGLLAIIAFFSLKYLNLNTP